MLVKMQPTTPAHNSLWHKDFVMLALAGMMMSVSAYMLLMMVPLQISHDVTKHPELGLQLVFATSAYFVGLFSLGPLCSWLVQHYRRGAVCVWALVGYTACALLTYFLFCYAMPCTFFIAVALRFFTGAFYGLVGMVLFSTLIVDKTESKFRTQANHSAAWFARIGLALGPMLSIVISRNYAQETICFVAFCFAVLATLLVILVKIPFKTPDDDVSCLSLDRFIMPQAIGLIVVTAAVFACFGYVLVQVPSALFYVLLLIGFLWTLISEHFSQFGGASQRNLFVSVVFVVAAMAAFLSPDELLSYNLVPCILGAGLGMAGSQSLLLLIEKSQHCRRGTAVSSFFLACEGGVALGTIIAVCLF